LDQVQTNNSCRIIAFFINRGRYDCVVILFGTVVAVSDDSAKENAQSLLPQFDEKSNDRAAVIDLEE